MLNHTFFRKEDKKVVCEICPNFCVMKDGQKGVCLNRKNENGELVSTTYGKVTAIAMDPIEKKPLYHLFPGKKILSIGTYGCSLGCIFCQNCEISQNETFTQDYSIDDLISICKKNNSFGIAYTYNEPLIWYEFVLDCSKRVKEEGLYNIFVTNGYINEKPFEKLLPYIDGINIDLKSMSPDFYKKAAKGKLEPVKKTIKKSYGNAVLEITNLLITDLNDSEEEMNEMVDWIADISNDIPFHISRYFPCYKLSNPPTSMDKLRRFYEIASKKLKFVYIGNAYLKDSSDTFCPKCGEKIIDRKGYNTEVLGINEGGNCKYCGNKIYGILK